MAFDANDLSPHEHFVLERTRLGEIADFSPLAGADGAKPGVRAGFLRKLLLRLDTSWPVTPAGVRIKSARLEGVLDLTDCSTLPALALEACDVPETMALERASLVRLSLCDSSISGVRAAGLVLDGVLDLSGVHAATTGEPCWFAAPGARIGGDVIAARAKLATQPPRAAAALQHSAPRYALDLGGAQIAGGVRLGEGHAAQGGVNLGAAQIGGGLDGRGAAMAAGEGAALQLTGARTGGDILLCDGFLASGAVQMDRAIVNGDVRLGQARFESAAIAFDLSHAEIAGSVGGAFKSDGAAKLANATLGGYLDLRGAEIGARKLGASSAAGAALDAGGVRVGGAMLLHGVNVKGETHLADARIAGHLGLGGGRFINGGGWAIRARDAQVGGNLSFKIDENGYAPHGQKTVIEGSAAFERARVGGALAWLNLELRGPGADGGKGGWLSFADAEIDGALQAHGLVTQQGARIHFAGARCHSLNDDPKNGWGIASAELDLTGFDYTRIDGADESLRARLAWLRRSRFAPQPYDVLARAYARAGRRDDARRVALAQRDAQTARSAGAPVTWLLSSLFGVIAGYGLAPVRMLRTLILFIALGLVGVLAMNAQGALVTPEGRACNSAAEPALYALDVALPLDLGQTRACAPGRTARADLPQGVRVADGDLVLFEGVAMWRWAQALYALFGAILAALAVITFSGMLRPRSD